MQTVKNQVVTEKIPSSLKIKTERLTITEIRQQDKQRYFQLYVDKELNALWGYDYTEDLGDNKVSPDFFFDLQNKFKVTEKEYAFAVRLDGQMIGELVLYNPREDGSVEIGFRFFKQYHGKGYAVESAKALIDYAKNTLGARQIKGRCFKENLQSKALFLRLGFNVCDENSTHYFFKLNK